MGGAVWETAVAEGGKIGVGVKQGLNKGWGFKGRVGCRSL